MRQRKEFNKNDWEYGVYVQNNKQMKNKPLFRHDGTDHLIIFCGDCHKVVQLKVMSSVNEIKKVSVEEDCTYYTIYCPWCDTIGGFKMYWDDRKIKYDFRDFKDEKT